MKNFDRIARLLSDELSDQERSAFYEEMRSDEELRLDYLKQAAEEAAIEKLAVQNLKDRLTREPSFFSKWKSRFFWGFAILFAATLALFLYKSSHPVPVGKPGPIESATKPLIPTAVLDKKENKSPQEAPIFFEERNNRLKSYKSQVENTRKSSEKIEAYPAPNPIEKDPKLIARHAFEETLASRQLRSNSAGGANTAMDAVIEAFKNEDYLETIRRANPLIKSNSEWKNDALQWRAFAYFMTGQYEMAANQFQALLEEGNPFLQNDREWYLLLSYIGQWPNKKAETEKLLSDIQNTPGHSFYAEANKIYIIKDNQLMRRLYE